MNSYTSCQMMRQQLYVKTLSRSKHTRGQFWRLTLWLTHPPPEQISLPLVWPKLKAIKWREGKYINILQPPSEKPEVFSHILVCFHHILCSTPCSTFLDKAVELSFLYVVFINPEIPYPDKCNAIQTPKKYFLNWSEINAS